MPLHKVYSPKKQVMYNEVQQSILIKASMATTINITSEHRRLRWKHLNVWWSHQQIPFLPPGWVSCHTWDTVYFVPVRLSSRWWGSSAGQRKWAVPHACVAPGGEGPLSFCVLPLHTLFHIKESVGGDKHWSKVRPKVHPVIHKCHRKF